MSDVPIEQGAEVIDIGEVRVAKGLTLREPGSCPHKRLVYDSRERRVWCKDCRSDVEPFDAFKVVCENYDRALKHLAKRRHEVEAAEQANLVRIAAKRMDDAWRSRRWVPACPHCGEGLLAEDMKNARRTSREIALARRKRGR